MNYKKVYDRLITSRILLGEERIIKKKNGDYFEKHHIIPKAKGGSNKKDNLVLLTAREHFLAHWLLWLIHKDRQTAYGFHKMLSINSKQKRIISSKGYEEAREAINFFNKGNTYGKKNKGIKRTDAYKLNHSLKMKGKFSGENNPFFGKKHSIETKRKLKGNFLGKTGEKSPNFKGNRVVYKDGLNLGVFKNNIEVSNFINSSAAAVKNVLGGSQKTTKGYVIKYEKDINNLQLNIIIY